MTDWEWLLQLVIVIVEPLAVSLYRHHKIVDGGPRYDKTDREKQNSPEIHLCNHDVIHVPMILKLFMSSGDHIVSYDMNEILLHLRAPKAIKVK